MEKDKKDIIITLLAVILGISLLTIGYLLGNNKTIINNTQNKEPKSKENRYIEDNSPKDNENYIKEDNNPTTTSTTKKITTTTKKKETLTQKDEIVIKKVEELETETDEILNNTKSEDAKDKAKAVFVTLVDFLFYDGEIKGVTFDELSETGKEKVLKLASSIDTKIGNKYPNYKDTISTNTKSAYNKASELIKKGASKVSEFSKEKLGEENYNSIIEAKDELVKYSIIAGTFIKDFSTNIYSQTKDKLKKGMKTLKIKNTRKRVFF